MTEATRVYVMNTDPTSNDVEFHINLNGVTHLHTAIQADMVPMMLSVLKNHGYTEISKPELVIVDSSESTEPKDDELEDLAVKLASTSFKQGFRDVTTPFNFYQHVATAYGEITKIKRIASDAVDDENSPLHATAYELQQTICTAELLLLKMGSMAETIKDRNPQVNFEWRNMTELQRHEFIHGD